MEVRTADGYTGSNMLNTQITWSNGNITTETFKSVEDFNIWFGTGFRMEHAIGFNHLNLEKAVA